MRHWHYLIPSLLLLPLLGGCSPYVGDYAYVPRPGVAEVAPTPPQQTPPVTGLATVVGVRNDSPKEGLPPSVEIRFRLDNNGPQPITFDPRTLELTTSTLFKFPPPLVRPPEPVTVEPMQSVFFEMYFPFPPGHSYSNTDLNNLELRWLVDCEGRTQEQVVDFHRMVWAYYGPYYDYPPYYPYGFYGGVVVVRHR